MNKDKIIAPLGGIVVRVHRFILNKWNIFKIRQECDSVGKNLWVVNKIRIENRGGAIMFGDNCIILSDTNYNPLAANLATSIVVNSNAELHIGNQVGMSAVNIWCHEKIEIGDRTTIGAMAIIIDSDCHSLNYQDRWTERDMLNKKNAPIIIGKDVLIGTRSIILKGVSIGDRSIIAAGAVVSKNIPSDCIAAGNPARVVKQLKWD